MRNWIILLVIACVFILNCSGGNFLDIIGDKVAPVIGNLGEIEISNVHKTYLTVSWYRASDNISKTKNLEYKVFQSLVDNIGDVNSAEINGKTAVDWEKNYTEAKVTGLTMGQKYFFNVLVRDESGNIASYKSNSAVPIYRELAELTASDVFVSSGFGGFGFSTSISSDGSTIVVGAPWKESSTGAAYIFVKTEGSWSSMTEQAILTASDGAANDVFGRSVSITSDGSTIIVGAENNSGKGSVYIFNRPAGGWASATENAKLTASDGAAGDFFGLSVSISSNGSIVAAGAPGAVSGKGSIYIFMRPGSVWASATQNDKLTASDGVAGDFFARNLSISSDGKTLVAGADADDGKGSVYIFKNTVGIYDPLETAKLTASDGVAGDNFGFCVSITGDGSTVVAGAFGDDSNKGSVYIFNRTGGVYGPTENAKLIASNGVAEDYFGYRVSISSDASVIGISTCSPMPHSKYSVYIFQKPLGGWISNTEDTELLDPNPGDASFGQSLALSSDGSSIVITREGIAYVFE